MAKKKAKKINGQKILIYIMLIAVVGSFVASLFYI